MARRCASSPISRTRRSRVLTAPRIPRSGTMRVATGFRPGLWSGISEVDMPSAIPLATYRLQLTADFDFDKAAAVVPYLKSLGITHLYASPVMKARKGSTHGYDTVDHSQF